MNSSPFIATEVLSVENWKEICSTAKFGILEPKYTLKN